MTKLIFYLFEKYIKSREKLSKMPNAFKCNFEESDEMIVATVRIMHTSPAFPDGDGFLDFYETRILDVEEILEELRMATSIPLPG